MTTLDIEGRRLGLTNLDKVLWPEAGLTKGKLIEYYVRVAPALLPHLEGRPLTLRRFPDGVHGVSWHQNECRGEPEWFHVVETRGVGGRVLRFCVVNDLASLVWVANQAAIELHPFQWRTGSPRRSRSLVFDLDPGPPAGLLEAARVALLLRALLEELGLRCFAKASGSVGLHVHVPLGLPGDAKALAHEIASALALRHPQQVVAEMDRRARVAKVYVDWLQNDPSRQTVSAYSLRGMPWPTVAAPVSWDEVEEAAARRRPERLTVLMDDVPKRLERHGDIFEPLLEAELAGGSGSPMSS